MNLWTRFKNLLTRGTETPSERVERWSKAMEESASVNSPVAKKVKKNKKKKIKKQEYVKSKPVEYNF
tara:strand:+ start:2673 stop:2873 length:201 start_codon:yes stop_codon:yes gene_type:complete